jgi:hypothetical protein
MPAPALIAAVGAEQREQLEALGVCTAAVGAELGVPSPALDDALALLGERPELAADLDLQVERIAAAIGTLDVPGWPGGPGADTERFQLLALLAAVPAARTWFAAMP